MNMTKPVGVQLEGIDFGGLGITPEYYAANITVMAGTQIDWDDDEYANICQLLARFVENKQHKYGFKIGK